VSFFLCQTVFPSTAFCCRFLYPLFRLQFSSRSDDFGASVSIRRTKRLTVLPLVWGMSRLLVPARRGGAFRSCRPYLFPFPSPPTPFFFLVDPKDLNAFPRNVVAEASRRSADDPSFLSVLFLSSTQALGTLLLGTGESTDSSPKRRKASLPPHLARCRRRRTVLTDPQRGGPSVIEAVAARFSPRLFSVVLCPFT